MPGWLNDVVYIIVAVFLVLLNGFFVAAEFALVKLRGIHLDELVREKRPFARTARWLGERLEASLSVCQLGITMASLGLGWIGEPAFARLLTPILNAVGIDSPTAVHTTAFIVAFGGITVLHLVIGEQVPKIYAIKRPARVLIWCALPLKISYVLLYPLLIALKAATSFLLGLAGIKEGEGHENPLSEAEIRSLLEESHVRGEMSRGEHRMLEAVFEFHDVVCRRVMTPRADVAFFDINQPLSDNIKRAKEGKHTRYPVCEASLEKIIGVVHVKDLVGIGDGDAMDLRSVLRPPHRIPETMLISSLLRHFQETRQHMAFVVDEYGTLAGIVTLENVLEVIVGPVEDEFDTEEPEILPDGAGGFAVLGGARIDLLNHKLKLRLDTTEADTISGLLTARLGRLLQVGDIVELQGAKAEVLEMKGERAWRILLRPDTDSEEVS
ncbi:hemolysin family protein [Candidatus Sumerlaeota bacterium]